MNTSLTPEQHKRTADMLQRLVLRDIPGMTVTEHHGLCIGILAVCYEHVDADLQRAIAEMFESAKAMGMNIRPELVTQRRNSAKNERR